MTASVDTHQIPLRIADIAARMGLTTGALYAAIHRQAHGKPVMELPPMIKIARKWAIYPEDLDNWLREQRRNTPLRRS